jgi:hydroxymethylpyrimidine pyrophosphatase-like HAD family hydrolase
MHELSEEDLELIKEALSDLLDIEQTTLNIAIDEDQTPETVDEFLEVVSTQQDKIAAINTLAQRLGLTV